jgi:hypothetical protein
MDVEISIPLGSEADHVWAVVDAVSVGENWAYHVEILQDDDGDWAEGRKWNVTHIPTGRALLQGVSRPVAKAVAEKIVEGGMDIDTEDADVLWAQGRRAFVGRVLTAAKGRNAAKAVRELEPPRKGRTKAPKKRAPAEKRSAAKKPSKKPTPSSGDDWTEFLRRRGL